jgi:hypothetical protein
MLAVFCQAPGGFGLESQSTGIRHERLGSRDHELGTGRSHQPRLRREAPADLISKVDTGRLWGSLFYLRSGMPD